MCSEVEVVGGEVFRAPGWSAGLLHLHFSVARGVPVRVEEVENLMIKDDERNPRAGGRYVNRVSSAVWPASIRRVVSTGKAAQRRRDWIMQRRWLVILADALSMRALLVLTTLLVVVSSLLVAILGLQFWYILLVPLLLFLLMLFLPLFLASKMPMEAIPPSLSTFAQEFRSSAGILSLSAQELKSGSGYLAEPRSSPGVLAVEAPATPMPAEPPLVRVLETYDLREVQVKRLLGEILRGETGEHTVIRRLEKDFWKRAPSNTSLDLGIGPLEASDVSQERADGISSQDNGSQDPAP